MSFWDSAVATEALAPYWLIETLKIAGFSLHLTSMGLLLAGLPLSVLFWLFGGVNCKRMAQRLFQQFPVVVALVINFGLVPLLFIQLAYSKLFYTTTIIVAAHWLGILPLVFLGYCFVYFCASCAKRERLWSVVIGACVSSFCFLCVGLIFTDVWTLFERPYELEGLVSSFVVDLGPKRFTFGGNGAVNGFATYWSDLVVYIRYAGILGLACHTLGFWIVFDTFKLYRGPRPLTEDEELLLLEAENGGEEDGKKKRRSVRLPIHENPEKYQAFATSVACFLIVLGLLVSIPAFFTYVNRALSDVAAAAPNPVLWNVLFWGTFSFLILPFLFLVLGKLKKLSGKKLALCLMFCEACLIGLYATLRQTIQNIQLSPYFDPSNGTIASEVEEVGSNSIQWTPIFAFLGVLVVVLAIIVFLVKLMADASKETVDHKAKKEKSVKKVREPKKKSEKKADEEKSSSPASKLTLGGGVAARPTKGGTASSNTSGKKLPR